MEIVIVGLGKIGRTILASLVKEKHNVFAIDTDPDVVEKVRSKYDVMALCASGTEYDILKEAGVPKAELFIAVTGSDELNMLSCFAAKRMGAKYTVARIRDLENNDNSLDFMKSQLEISMAINPEKLSAEAMYNILQLPSATKVETFSSNRLEMIEVLIKPDSPWAGLNLIELRKKYKEKFLIGTVCRGDKVYIPNGLFDIQGGDRVGIITSRNDTESLLSKMGIFGKAVKDVIILGAGITSNYLAKMLVSDRRRVKLIDIDKAVCEEVCETLPDTVSVINGDGMSQDLLIEEGISTTDAFVALTGSDEENILVSFYAKAQNVQKVIAKVNREELSSLAENLGLDCLISPRKIVADVIVQYARALENSIDSQIETLYSVMNGMAEAIEFKVLPDFKYAGIPLKEMKLVDGVLIAGITRGKQAIIPSGDDVILSGDDVVVIAEGQRILSLTDIVKR